MLPGKKYTPEDFVWIAWSRKWFIVVPTVLIAAGTFLYARSLPNQYRSSALVMVLGQQVPKDLVKPTVTDSVDDQLRAITQRIVSRTKLENIIQEFDLYKEKRRDGVIMEDIVEQMRARDIGIDIPRGPNANHFTVSFTAEQPRTAMLVAEKLASLFVQENSMNRAATAGSTSEYISSALAEAERKMKEYDAQIATFRARNSGRMPTQMQSNVQMVMNVQAQIEANNDAANRDRDRIAQLESKIVDLESIVTIPARSPETALAGPRVNAQLEAARRALETLLLKHRDDHPDVRKKRYEIADLEAKAAGEEPAPVSVAPGETPTIPSMRAADAERLMNMRYEVDELRSSVARRTKEDARLRAQLSQYTARLESTPGVESEYMDLMRNYDTEREAYEDLLKKYNSAKLAEGVERREIGEKFQVTDAARLPERPISPNRTRLNLMGLLAGLAFGVGLAALLEYRDTTLKTDDDIITTLALPVLAVIPAMTNGRERAQQRRRKRLVLLAASTASLLLIVVAVAWKYRLIQELVR